jgi:hypothetical protein
MSRITGSDAKGLMEAYAAVYAPQELTEEQIWEEVENWVNSLLEEGYDLSEYTWEEMYESYIEENSQELGASARQAFGTARRAVGDVIGAGAQGMIGQRTTSTNPLARLNNLGNRVLSKPFREVNKFNMGFATGKDSTPQEKPSASPEQKPRVSNIPTGTKNSPYNQKNLGGDQFKAYKAGGGDAAMAKGSGTAAEIIAKGRKALTPSGSGSGGSGSGGSGSGGSGSGGGNPPAPAPQRPAAAAPARPAAAKPAKPAGSAMDQWASTPANKRLAAAAAEKARIRGTQQTDNPLMKDMRSRLPMNSPSVQSPAVSNLGKGNQSLSQNPNAFKAATPSKAIAAAPSTSAAASGSVVPATAAIASSPKPTPVAPRQTAREKVLNQSYEYDAFDLVLEYLIDNEHVETVDEALYVMMEMDSETILGIVSEQSNTLITPEQRRADELKYGIKRTTPVPPPVPPAKPGGAKVKPGSKMPL